MLRYDPDKLVDKSVTFIRNKLDEICKLTIIIRDNGVCETCGASTETKQISCGHLLTRASYSTRWYEPNMHAQCTGCNIRHEERWDIYLVAWIKIHGASEYDFLRQKHHTCKKMTTVQKANIFASWQTRLREELIIHEFWDQFRTKL